MLVPKYLKKHKLIKLLLSLNLINEIQLVKFNSTSYAYIDCSDPEPRNVLIKETFDLDFFEVAKCFLNDNSIFFDLGANHGLCTFGLLPDLRIVRK